MLERAAIGALSVFGLLISAYFAVTYHKLLPDVNRYLPSFCRIDPGTCSIILETRQARLFGAPNFDLGMLYYLSLLGSVLVPNLWKQLYLMLFGGSIVTVAAGFYLAYVLVFRLRVRCTLCFLSHAINFLIFLILLTSL